METKFKVGNQVIVIDSEKTYDSYQELIDLMTMKGTNWDKGTLAPEKSIYTIINIKKHLQAENIIYLIRSVATSKEYLICEEGLKLPKSQIGIPLNNSCIENITYEGI